MIIQILGYNLHFQGLGLSNQKTFHAWIFETFMDIINDQNLKFKNKHYFMR